VEQLNKQVVTVTPREATVTSASNWWSCGRF